MTAGLRRVISGDMGARFVFIAEVSKNGERPDADRLPLTQQELQTLHSTVYMLAQAMAAAMQSMDAQVSLIGLTRAVTTLSLTLNAYNPVQPTPNTTTAEITPQNQAKEIRTTARDVQHHIKNFTASTAANLLLQQVMAASLQQLDKILPTPNKAGQRIVRLVTLRGEKVADPAVQLKAAPQQPKAANPVNPVAIVTKAEPTAQPSVKAAPALPSAKNDKIIAAKAPSSSHAVTPVLPHALKVVETAAEKTAHKAPQARASTVAPIVAGRTQSQIPTVSVVTEAANIIPLPSHTKVPPHTVSSSVHIPSSAIVLSFKQAAERVATNPAQPQVAMALAQSLVADKAPPLATAPSVQQGRVTEKFQAPQVTEIVRERAAPSTPAIRIPDTDRSQGVTVEKPLSQSKVGTVIESPHIKVEGASTAPLEKIVAPERVKTELPKIDHVAPQLHDVFLRAVSEQSITPKAESTRVTEATASIKNIIPVKNDARPLDTLGQTAQPETTTLKNVGEVKSGLDPMASSPSIEKGADIRAVNTAKAVTNIGNTRTDSTGVEPQPLVDRIRDPLPQFTDPPKPPVDRLPDPLPQPPPPEIIIDRLPEHQSPSQPPDPPVKPQSNLDTTDFKKCGGAVCTCVAVDAEHTKTTFKRRVSMTPTM